MIPALLFFKEQPNIQMLTLNLLSLEYALESYYSTGLAKPICPGQAVATREGLAVHHCVRTWPGLPPPVFLRRAARRTLTRKQAGHGNSKASHLPSQEHPEGTREEEANYIFLLLNMCSARKQCAQAPGEINILIPVSRTDEGAAATVREC